MNSSVNEMEEGQVCDSCDLPATKILRKETSQWCANWFIGHYCDDCYNKVESEMKRICESEKIV